MSQAHPGEASISRQTALKIINALSTGTPPDEEVGYFSVGREDLLDYFRHKFREIKDTGISSVKFVEADYGEGKTHFLDLLRQVALEDNFVVSKIELRSGEVTFDKFDLVFRELMNSTWTPDYRVNALEKTLDRWAASVAGKSRAEIYGVLDQLPELSPDLRLVLTNYALKRNESGGSGREECLQLLMWLQGRETDHYFRRRYHLSGSVGPTNVSELLRGLVAFLRFLGYSGFVVMVDEAEAIPQLTRTSQVDRANENIRRIIDNDKNTEAFYFLFATTPRFLDENEPKGARMYDALWRRISSPLRRLGSSLDSVIIRLPDLTEEEFYEIASNIKSIFEVARERRIDNIDPSHLRALAGYVKTSAGGRVATLVRSTVQILDLAAADEQFDFLREFELVVGRVIADERKHRIA